MCIRDRNGVVPSGASPEDSTTITGNFIENWIRQKAVLHKACLLYTSDAADERSSVDLGGRRIIKKKKSTTRRSTENSQ